MDFLSLFAPPHAEGGAGSTEHADETPESMLPSATIDLPVDLKEVLNEDVADPGNLDAYLGYSPSLSPPDSPPDFFVPQEQQIEELIGLAVAAPHFPSRGKPVPSSVAEPAAPSAGHRSQVPLDPAMRGGGKIKTDPWAAKAKAEPVPDTGMLSEQSAATAAANGDSKRRYSAASEAEAEADPASLGLPENADEQTIKKARRMQKNRESAMLSRQRKKAHLEGLEATNQKLAAVNDQLARDKASLLERVVKLEGENRALKEELALGKGRAEGVVPATGATAFHGMLGGFNGGLGTTTLMACLLCFAFYGSPGAEFGGLNPSTSRQAAPSLVPHRHFGRSLQSIVVNPLPQTSHAAAASLSGSEVASTDTPERRIVATTVDTVRGSDVEYEVQRVRREIENRFNLSDYHPAVARPTADGGASSAGTDLVATVSASSHDMDSLHGEWPVPPVFRLRNELTGRQMRSFRKRTDTSYVFCTEVQVVSAATLNEDGVPRMSVLMPAPDHKDQTSTTQTNGTHIFSMLQVDCNVEGTTAIHLTGNSTAGRDAV